MLKKRELLLFAQDRLAVSLLVLMALGALVLVVMAAFSVRMSDVQVPFRYSGYGFTNLYRDKWYALLSLGIFPLIVLFVNGFLATKIHATKRSLALGLLAISLLIIVLSLIVSYAVFRLAALSL